MGVRKEGRREGRTHRSVALLHGEPVLADEVELLHRLQVTDDDVFQEPRRRRALARVVVPHANVVQQSQ